MIELTRQREARGWNKTELAREAGIQQSVVGMIENRRLTAPYPAQLHKLAKALDFKEEPEFLLREAD